MRADSERILDMLDAITAIERRKPPNKRAFDADELVQVWILRHIQIIGEAAAGISPATRERAPKVPWGQIVGMRNALVHAYFNLDWDAVWMVVVRDLPSLQAQLRELAGLLRLNTESTAPRHSSE